MSVCQSVYLSKCECMCVHEQVSNWVLVCACMCFYMFMLVSGYVHVCLCPHVLFVFVSVCVFPHVCVFCMCVCVSLSLAELVNDCVHVIIYKLRTATSALRRTRSLTFRTHSAPTWTWLTTARCMHLSTVCSDLDTTVEWQTTGPFTIEPLDAFIKFRASCEFTATFRPEVGVLSYF